MRTRLRTALVLAGAALIQIPPWAGCVREGSFPIETDAIVAPHSAGPAASSGDVRRWLRQAHARLSHLLPTADPPALLTEDLVRHSASSFAVFPHFGLQPWALKIVPFNYFGLLNSAQSIARGTGHASAQDPWPGFEDVRIPIRPGLHLAGRLSLAEQGGRKLHADCIVVLPGFLGDNTVNRTRNLAEALRVLGHHVLAVEPRGHGRTEAEQPHVPYTWATLETGDLMAVDEWLRTWPQVRRVGLVGFCWGANAALLAAWYDGLGSLGPRAAANNPDIRPLFARLVRPVTSPRHFDAGVIAFCPVLRFEEIIDQLDSPRPILLDLALGPLQETVRRRCAYKNHAEVTGSLRKLIQFELDRSELASPTALEDGLQFLRFLPQKGRPVTDKLNLARVPVLIVAAANDPLTSAQNVADLFAGQGITAYPAGQSPETGLAPLTNPKVAALILAGGGHCGFAPYARAYYYSLIAAFFAAEAPRVPDA